MSSNEVANVESLVDIAVDEAVAMAAEAIVVVVGIVVDSVVVGIVAEHTAAESAVAVPPTWAMDFSSHRLAFSSPFVAMAPLHRHPCPVSRLAPATTFVTPKV